MIVYYTHWCLNCGDPTPTGVSGAPTTLWEEACARCGSLSVVPIAHDSVPAVTLDADYDMEENPFQVILTLATLYEQMMREKDARIRELENALRGASHVS